VGDSIDDLRRAKAHFDALGVSIDAIEVYVDTSDVWRTDPRTVASISPLTL
jgi:hypothetical protein